jgi:acetylornithine deacetylase/succinyl-diaminopimelate desuccinylase-like protein
MRNCETAAGKVRKWTIRRVALCAALAMSSAAATEAQAQRGVLRDPAEPQQKVAKPKILPRPSGAMARAKVDEKSMRALIEELVACGTRLTLSSWSDPKRGVGCARDHIAARLTEISKQTGGKLQVVVDKFESTSARTSDKPVPLENVYGILPGNDPALAKTIFIVSGHYDSRPSDVMDTQTDAPGADDDASGVAVSVESARLLSKAAADAKGGNRATILFAAVSGEEQGLLGSTHLLEWVKEKGYTVGGLLDDDIVGDDLSAGRIA